MSCCSYPFDARGFLREDFFDSFLNKINYILHITLLITWMLDKVESNCGHPIFKFFLSGFFIVISPYTYHLTVIFSYFFCCGYFHWFIFVSSAFYLMKSFMKRAVNTDESRHLFSPFDNKKFSNYNLTIYQVPLTSIEQNLSPQDIEVQNVMYFTDASNPILPSPDPTNVIRDHSEFDEPASVPSQPHLSAVLAHSAALPGIFSETTNILNGSSRNVILKTNLETENSTQSKVNGQGTPADRFDHGDHPLSSDSTPGPSSVSTYFEESSPGNIISTSHQATGNSIERNFVREQDVPENPPLSLLQLCFRKDHPVDQPKDSPNSTIMEDREHERNSGTANSDYQQIAESSDDATATSRRSTTKKRTRKIQVNYHPQRRKTRQTKR